MAGAADVEAARRAGRTGGAIGLRHSRDFDFGDYRLAWNGHGLALSPKGDPGKRLWATEGGFLAAGIGEAQVEEHRGALFVDERRELLCREQSLDSFQGRASGWCCGATCVAPTVP